MPIRPLLCALALGLFALPLADKTARAQGGRDGKAGAKSGDIYDDKQSIQCPLCDKLIEFNQNSPPSTCPHCSKKVKLERKGEDAWTIKSEEANPLQKVLVYGGGGVLVLALVGLVLMKTVFAPAKPKKKKKKRRDDDDEDDDRPRKRQPVVDDDDDDRPRKVKKKPRIADDED